MSEAIASKAERLAAYNANIAAAEKDPSLSPETGKPLSKMNAARFGAGFLVFGVLWMSGLGIVSAVLLPMHYKTIPGVNADALVGIVNAFTAVASLVANLMFGNFSDRSRSRFGRRTPWILFGAVLGGVTLFLTGTTHNAVLLTIFYCACMFGLNCMIAPMVAILSDRVPSKIRGTMSAFYGAGSTIGAPIGTMLGALFIENLIPGFAVAGVLMFLGGVVAVIIIPKEQSADFLPKDEGSAKDILSSFRPPKFAGAHDFYKAFAGRFCMLMSYQMINVYQLYIIQNYIGQSDSSDEDYDDDYTITRTNGVAFVIDGAAYLTCGESGSLRSDTWKYYPATDLWENVAKFKGTARTATASFSSGEKGFVVSGKSGTTQFDDIWEFHPNEYDDDEY